MLRKQIGNVRICVNLPAKLGKVPAAGQRFHTAYIATPADLFTAVHRDVSQFSGGAVFAYQRLTVYRNRISDAGSKVKAADNPSTGNVVFPAIIFQCKGHVTLNEHRDTQFL